MPPKLLHAVDLSKERHIREGEQKAASEQGEKKERGAGRQTDRDKETVNLDGGDFLKVCSLAAGDEVAAVSESLKSQQARRTLGSGIWEVPNPSPLICHHLVDMEVTG